ncbi:MAG TPA: hypothetical protein VLT33_42135 [Labilithrix sp.]|nr:hypothetical protein [Labilithrix sp.]
MSARAPEIRVAAGLVLAALAGCSAADEAPFVEYPDGGGATEDGGGGRSDARAPVDGGDAEAAAPLGGKQVVAGPVFIQGATSDGNLVFDDGKDVKVLVGGSLTPITVLADYDSGGDSLLVRGRFVAFWLGSVAAVPLGLWSKTGGVQKSVAPLTYAQALYPRYGTDDLAYAAPAGSSLRRDLWATTAGAGAGTKVVADLDTGVVSASCRPTVAWSATALVVAGCPSGAATPNVSVYAADGSGPTKTVLAASAPGLWLNRARTHALVQTTTASSLRPLSGAAAPVAIDGPIRAAAFSSDDAFVVYRQADGAVKRASTTAPAAPLSLVPSALAMYAVSPDARLTLVATTGNVDQNDADVVLADATTPGTLRTLAEHAAFIGLSASGTHAVWLGELGIGLEGALYVAALPSGAPQKLSPLAERVSLDGDVVYWQEFDKATKSNVLKAARVATPGNVITIEKGLDALTAQTLVIGKSLFVASKLGLWGYPAVTP